MDNVDPKQFQRMQTVVQGLSNATGTTVPMYQVNTPQQLANLITAPPAIAYVNSLGKYYIYQSPAAFGGNTGEIVDGQIVNCSACRWTELSMGDPRWRRHVSSVQ